MNARRSDREASAKAVAAPATALAGFTLVELLVVVAIVALLVGLMVPTLGGAREVARRLVCTSNQRQVTTALWAYITDNDGHVPYVESPMHNNAFGDASVPDVRNNPFDEQRWPDSLPHALEDELSGSWEVFECPSAEVAWPREPNDAQPNHMAYRPASANQPNGVTGNRGEYFRESFGFLDGRRYEPVKSETTDDPMARAMQAALENSVYLRDLVRRNNDGTVSGPHGGGTNVVNRDLEVEFRDEQTTNRHLAPGGHGVKF